MKRAILALFLAVGTVAFAAPPEDFTAVIDFSISTRELVELVRAENFERIDPDRYLVLQGSVASTTVLDPAAETYQALVELVASEWVGLTDIEVYRVYVLLNGPEFSTRVVERLPRNPGPEIILPNRELLVVGQYVGAAEGDDGSLIPVVVAIALR